MIILELNEVKEIQKVSYEILLEIDRICKKNDIAYMLVAGTALGAIRHKGFIPWDDDIDVGMIRSDYEKFIDLCLNKNVLGIISQTYPINFNIEKTFLKTLDNIKLNAIKLYRNKLQIINL